MTEDNSGSLLQFPCEFPIKVFGHTRDDFDGQIVSIIRRHAPALGEGAVSVRPSQGGKYSAVTVTIRAESQSQLDAIYRDLTASEDVLMAL
jgi:putative lipoic acid-binding regulatory protein